MVIKLLLAVAVVASSVVSAQDSKFSIYKLSLTWPTSLCIARPDNCISPIPKIFTIHGLWPTSQKDNAVPPYNPVTNKCNPNPLPATAIVAELEPIRRSLETKWPNIFAGRTNEQFWETEWSHHGMCSDYPRDPFSYFSVTLNLASDSRYDPYKVLGVEPSDKPYPIDTLLENVKMKVGFYPQISCSMPIKGKQLYLKEVRFCFKNAKPPAQLKDCPNEMDSVCRSVQPLSRTVMYPKPINANYGYNETGKLLASA